jgi:serine/threonine protein phosphatase PrpC
MPWNFYGYVSPNGVSFVERKKHSFQPLTSAACTTGKPDMDYFALFDGHAGRIAATFCGEHLHKILAAKIAANAKDPTAAIAECYLEVNAQFKVR